MTNIYCLYSTEDGRPRYIGKASDKVSYRFKQHVTAALEMQSGALYDWMRDVWRGDHDVLCYTLQSDIAPQDEEMFEGYWMGQFSGLLNVARNQKPARDSALGIRVRDALTAALEFAREGFKP